MNSVDLQVEFGKQSALLQNEKGMLRALVDESGDREKSFVLFLLPPPRTTNYTFPIDSGLINIVRSTGMLS